MANPQKKNRQKLYASITIIIIACSLAAVAARYTLLPETQKPSQPSTMALTLIGGNGHQRNLTQNDILSLQAYSGMGGFRKSGGALSGISNYTGVAVTDLLNLVGGITSDDTLAVTASDGYSMSYTYNQVVNGLDFTTFDSTGSSVTTILPLKIVVAYSCNGTALTGDEGPLRLTILSKDGLLATGNMWVRMLTQLQVVSPNSPTASPTSQLTDTTTTAPTSTVTSTSSPTTTPSTNPASWTITINGSTATSMTQDTFATLTSQNTATYTESSTVWSGATLNRLVDWAQGNSVISSDSLTAGYVVKIVGSDGSIVTLNDSRLDGNQNIILANALNNSPLTGYNYPLTLTGSALISNEKVNGVTQIQILPIQHLAVTVVGANGNKITLFSNDLAKMATVTYEGGSKKSNEQIVNVGNYTGVKLVDLCSKVGFSSGNTVIVKASDGYTSTYSYDQVANGGGFATYDSSANVATASHPLYLILAYWFNGANLDSYSGPLKTMIVGQDCLITSGNLAARMVVEIDIS
jgi:DMSO/TMAO reductase YedYZ molybdopterin-dependent catalytic subunit